MKTVDKILQYLRSSLEKVIFSGKEILGPRRNMLIQNMQVLLLTNKMDSPLREPKLLCKSHFSILVHLLTLFNSKLF